jgi:transcriptional regulator with XRE-family HTH domain
MRSIGRAARQARRARRLTQEDVADRVGVSTQFYGRIERGYALPSVTTLRRMLDVLDLRADDLLGVAGIEATSDDDAPVQAQAQTETENPHLRRLMRYLRRASPVTLHVVTVLLDEIEKAEAILHGDRASARAGRDGSPPDEDEDARNDGDGPAGDSGDPGDDYGGDQRDAPEDPDQPDED